jgi:hypothetical protein
MSLRPPRQLWRTDSWNHGSSRFAWSETMIWRNGGEFAGHIVDEAEQARDGCPVRVVLDGSGGLVDFRAKPNLGGLVQHQDARDGAVLLGAVQGEVDGDVVADPVPARTGVGFGVRCRRGQLWGGTFASACFPGASADVAGPGRAPPSRSGRPGRGGPLFRGRCVCAAGTGETNRVGAGAHGARRAGGQRGQGSASSPPGQRQATATHTLKRHSPYRAMARCRITHRR